MTAMFKARDGRLLACHLVECAVALPGGYRVSLRGGYGSAEVDSTDFVEGRLMRAARDDVAVDAAGNKFRVLFWRVRSDSDRATPVLGLQLPD